MYRTIVLCKMIKAIIATYKIASWSSWSSPGFDGWCSRFKQPSGIPQWTGGVVAFKQPSGILPWMGGVVVFKQPSGILL